MRLLNAHHESVDFTLPPAAEGERWVLEFYTADDARGPAEPLGSPQLQLLGRSMAVLRGVRSE